MRRGILFISLILLAAPAQAQLRTELVVSGLPSLVAFVPDPLFPGVHYAVQQDGLVIVVQDGAVRPTPFLDLRGVVTPGGGEQGLLGLAFPSDAASGRVFVNFTTTSGDTVVARFSRTTANPFVLIAASRFDLQWPDGRRFIDQPFANHNGGHLAFGPDGYLYIGLGDGGSGNDPQNHAQNPNSLLGKMLRIDVGVPDSDLKGYRIPPDNPFLDRDPVAALGEIWDFGLRNPWRYTFDDPAHGGTGALFIGDVGEGAREEVSYEPPASGGRNYGWPAFEGDIPNPNRASPLTFQPATPPLLAYPRTGSFPITGTTVTGGYVYRGSVLPPQYRGRYFFADYGNGRVWSVAWRAEGDSAVVVDLVEHTAELGGPHGLISSFAVDLAGELYIVLYSETDSRVLKIVPRTTLPPSPPTVTAQVTNRDVTLRWNSVAGALQYRVEAGTEPALSNVVVFDTGSPATTVTAVDVPNGTYFVRVRSIGLAGIGSPSNEVVVSVGCTGPPAAPSRFTVTVSGRSVHAAWTVPPNLTAVHLEVGSAPTLANLALFVLPPSTSAVGGIVPPGAYHARLRAINACGASEPSAERLVTVP